jgi:hypothetical protein
MQLLFSKMKTNSIAIIKKLSQELNDDPKYNEAMKGKYEENFHRYESDIIPSLKTQYEQPLNLHFG